MKCENCHEREATEKWAGTEMMMALRGHFAMWCKLCCIREQVSYAEKTAAGLPERRKELEAEEQRLLNQLDQLVPSSKE